MRGKPIEPAHTDPPIGLVLGSSRYFSVSTVIRQSLSLPWSTMMSS